MATRLAPSGARVAVKMFTHGLAPTRLRRRMESTNVEGSMRLPSDTPPDHDRTAGCAGFEKSTAPVSLSTPDHGAVPSGGSSAQVRLRTLRASQRCRGPRGSVAHVAVPTSGGLGGGGGRGGGAGGRGGDHHGMLGGPGRGVEPVPIHVVETCAADVASTRLSPRTRTVQHGVWVALMRIVCHPASRATAVARVASSETTIETPSIATPALVAFVHTRSASVAGACRRKLDCIAELAP